MPHNKKQHTVPSTYLSNFAGQGGKVWVLRGQNIFSADPDDVLTENYYYVVKFPDGQSSMAVEVALSGIEGQFATVYREKIAQRLSLEPQERAVMAVFMATMMVRTKRFREVLREFFGSVVDIMNKMHALSDESKRRMSSMPTQKDPNQVMSETEVLDIHQNLDSHHSQLVIDEIQELAPMIYNMGWCFYEAPEGSAYITSDAPLVLVNLRMNGVYEAGLGQRHVELTIPIASDIALVAMWGDEVGVIYRSLPAEGVEQINIRTASHAQESLICGSEEMIKEIQRKIKKRQSAN